MSGSDAGRVVAWQYAGLYPQSVPPFRRDRADGYTIPLVPESLLAEAERVIAQLKDDAIRDIAGKLRAELQCRKLQAQMDAVNKVADKWDRIAVEHGVRQFTGNDHKLFSNEVRAALGET